MEARAPTRVPGRLERLCFERHEKDLALSLQPGGHPRGLWFDAEAGERVVDFIENYCQHHKGEWAGRPLILDEWERAWMRVAFGWKRPDGTRRFRTMLVEVPRKNGKSTQAAGIGLYLLVADGEPGAEIYASATKEAQARIVWGEAAKTARRSPKLKRHVNVFRSSIACERTGSLFAPLGSDSKTQDGLNPHGNIVDELHAHRTREMWDVLATAFGARRQPVTLAITTAGTFDPESIGWEQHDHAVKVLEGIYEDDSFFAFIATAEQDEKFLKERPGYYFSEEAQRTANPGYGVSVKPEYLKEQAELAKRSPRFFNTYLRLHLNIWTQQVTRWISPVDWSACDVVPDERAREVSLEREAALVGRPCYGGLDLATKLDLAAFVLVFPSSRYSNGSPPGEGDVVDLVCRFWLPQGTIDDRETKGHKFWAAWARDGWLTATPGDVIDYEQIRTDIKALCGGGGKPTRYLLREIAFDPWSATDLATRLGGDGYQMVETRQGFKTLSEPSKDFEARVVGKKVRHAGNPVLRYCVSNAVVVTDPAGNIKPDKEKASGRIDGVVASVMGLSRVICNKAAGTGRSAYETEKLTII